MVATHWRRGTTALDDKVDYWEESYFEAMLEASRKGGNELIEMAVIRRDPYNVGLLTLVWEVT